MGRTPESVRFARAQDGHVSVSAPHDLQPIDDFLESDIGENVAELESLIAHAREPNPAPRGFAGDSCHVSIGPEDVRVENDFTGEYVTLPRVAFLDILTAYAGAIGA